MIDTHYKPGADTNHFLGLCEECDAHYMCGMTLEKAQHWYELGRLSQDKYEAYRYVWATSAHRYSIDAERLERSTDPNVIRIVTRCQRILLEKMAAK